LKCHGKIESSDDKEKNQKERRDKNDLPTEEQKLDLN
jgi:hypothetical protein